jgi:YVTN family beta-propeller protein
MIYDPDYSPDQVAVTPDGKKVYVTDEGSYDVSGNVSVIYTATNQVIATVTVGDNPIAIVTATLGS